MESEALLDELLLEGLREDLLVEQHEALPPDLREDLQDGLLAPTGESHKEQQEMPQSHEVEGQVLLAPSGPAEMPQSRGLGEGPSGASSGDDP